VLPIPKVSNPAGFSFVRIVFFPVCPRFLMVGQMNGHIRNLGLLFPFQSGFSRHHSTSTAILKVTEDIRLNLEDIGYGVPQGSVLGLLLMFLVC
jgi:hypothetical protein